MKKRFLPNLVKHAIPGLALLLIASAPPARGEPPTVSSGTLTVWLDAVDPNGDGVLPANGAPVTNWVNKALGGVGNFTETTGRSLRPIYLASSGAFNAQPVIHFAAGYGRALKNTANFGNTLTVLYVGRKNGTDSGRLVSSVSPNWLLGYWGNNMNCSFWNGPGNYRGTATSDNAAHVWAGTGNGSAFFVHRAETTGETQVDSGSLGSGPSGLCLGSFNDGEVGGGDIGEVLVYNGALSDADRQSVEAYLTAKWLPTSFPLVDAGPKPLTAFEGEYGTLAASAGGTPPFTYQWQKGNTDIEGATNATYSFSGRLVTGDSGDYAVVISNSQGSVTSAPATVLVQAVSAIPDGLAGYWNFDEGSGSVLIDYSGNGNDGTLVNFPGDDSQWVGGRIGGALNFRGPANGDYVVVPNYPKPGSTMTICAWVWADARPQWASIAKNWPSLAAQFHLGLNDTQGDLSNYLIPKAGNQLGPVREGATSPLPLGAWQHVALVCDGQNMQLYRNGVAVGAALAYDGSINTNLLFQTMCIGAKIGPGGVPPTSADSGYWQGRIDDLGLWTRALSAEEVLAIHAAGVNGVPLTEAVVGALPPAIGTPPQSLTVTEGDKASFTVSANGTPELTYQWRNNGVNLTDATNATLTLAAVCAGDAGDYDVVIRNMAGSITSTPPATLIVLPLDAPNAITDGLIGHWTFDDGAGMSAQDATAYANHGTLVNFPSDNSQWVPGRIGGALKFRGGTGQDYVLVADYPKPASQMTVSAWVWADSHPTWATIVKNWPAETTAQFHFGLQDSSGDLSNYLMQEGGARVGPVREGTVFPLGSWQHVALVCDGSLMRLYRNGSAVGEPLAYNGTIQSSSVNPSLSIGAKSISASLADSFWEGKMDDIGLWNRSLSSAEVRAIYSAGIEGRDLATASVLPILRIARTGNSVVVSWPSAGAGKCFVLEWADSLPAASWTPVGSVPELIDGRYSVTIEAGQAGQFYRLSK